MVGRQAKAGYDSKVGRLGERPESMSFLHVHLIFLDHSTE